MNPYALPILKQNINKIDWYVLSSNPSIFTYDYPWIQRHFYETYGKELIETLHHPKNFSKFERNGWYLED